MTTTNPFVRYGTIASDERFVGREPERASLRRRLYEARSSAALIGLTRIGKSSLANEILNEAPEGTRTGWVSLAGVRSGAEALQEGHFLVDPRQVGGELGHGWFRCFVIPSEARDLYCGLKGPSLCSG